MTNVLVVDDDEALAETLAVWLGKRGFAASHRASATDALAALEAGAWDVLITDLNMRAVDGIELCRRVVENRPDIPVLRITAFGSLDTAVAAIRAARPPMQAWRVSARAAP